MVSRSAALVLDEACGFAGRLSRVTIRLKVREMVLIGSPFYRAIVPESLRRSHLFGDLVTDPWSLQAAVAARSSVERYCARNRIARQ
ncbi:MAG: hypothetical protein ABR529_14520 [Actinomycetota bacterium]